MQMSIWAGRRRWVRTGAFITVVVAVVLLLAGGAGAGTGEMTAPGWEFVKTLTWPSAMVGVAFSPLGRALAALLDRLAVRTPTVAAGRDPELQELLSRMSEMLSQVADTVRRNNEVQAQTVDALQQIKQGLAILLDRTPRTGAIAG
ncbi:MAG TPA: hypothetical protein VGK74_22130 [Symbiobacteriaceae bacterium]|jgi:hypothetical protein